MKALYPICTAALVLLSSFDTIAQYRLPRFDLLAKEGIREVVVSKTPLRMVDRDGKDITEAGFDTTTSTIKRYVINAFGKIDSLFMYPSSGAFYKLTAICYNEEGQAVELITLNRDKVVEARTLIDRLEDGSIYSGHWEHDELRSESWINADNITTKTLSSRLGSSSTYTFNVEEDIETERWFKDAVLMHEEILDWESDRGMPTVMHYSLYEVEENSKPTSLKKTFKVNAKGQVVNEHMEFFYDPFLGHNFFKRHRKFKGILQPDESLFSLDSIATSQETSELWTFDGDEVIYRYDFRYLK